MFLVFFVATRAFAQGLGGRLFVGALYDPVFHATDETSSAGAHFDLSQNVIETTSSSVPGSETRLGVGVMIPIRIN